MNLRVTPNINTQSNKQNVNFGMIKCSPEARYVLHKVMHATGHDGRNVGAPVSMHLLSSNQSDVTGHFLRNTCKISQAEVEQLVKDFPDTYMVGGDRVEFDDFRILGIASKPLAKVRELAAKAFEITEDSVKRFVSKFGINKKEAKLREANLDVLDAVGIMIKE